MPRGGRVNCGKRERPPETLLLPAARQLLLCLSRSFSPITGRFVLTSMVAPLTVQLPHELCGYRQVVNSRPHFSPGALPAANHRRSQSWPTLRPVLPKDTRKTPRSATADSNDCGRLGDNRHKNTRAHARPRTCGRREHRTTRSDQ